MLRVRGRDCRPAPFTRMGAMASSPRRAHGTGRDAILRASVHVVAELGLRGMTFRAIADRAGVNNSLIAHYFGNRENLILEALEWAVDRSIEGSHLAEAVTSPEEFGTELAASLDSDVEIQAYQYEMILEARRRPELRPAIRKLYEKYESALEDSLADFGLGRTDEPTKRALFGAVDGLVLQRVSENLTADEFREALGRVILFARGAGTASPDTATP